MATRREILRSYFLDVARDLVAAGSVRKVSGQSYADVLRAEAPRILDVIAGDFSAVAREIGFELGTGLARAVEGVAQRQLSNFVSQVSSGLSELLSNKRRS